MTLSDPRGGVLTLTDPRGLPPGFTKGVIARGNVYRGLSSVTKKINE